MKKKTFKRRLARIEKGMSAISAINEYPYAAFTKRAKETIPGKTLKMLLSGDVRNYISWVDAFGRPVPADVGSGYGWLDDNGKYTLIFDERIGGCYIHREDGFNFSNY